ncbi:hypothetical protein V8F06_000190 [Rhypophila decipiens]
MISSRQEQPSGLDTISQHQTGSDSEDSTISSRPTKCLRIRLDMASTQFLSPSAHHINSLPGTTCSSGPSTIAYTSASDIDPYSAVSGVSSFNYPAAADSTLLTPVSSAGSPPMQQQRPSTKPGRGYDHSQTAVSGAQGPTPPNTSKLYYSSYPSSQSPSPLTVHPQVTEGGPYVDMGPYMAPSPPNGHHPSSPKAEIPPPIDPYLGHFTVSGGNEPEVAHHPFPDYHNPFQAVEVGPFMRTSTHMPLDSPHLHHRMPSSGAPTPLLGQPHPSHYRHPIRVGGIEDLRDPTMLPGNYPAHVTLSPGRRAQPRKKAMARKASRTPKTSPHTGMDGQNGINGHVDDDDRDELTLRDDAPDDDKYLFQLRKEFISEKGKGMWEEMKAKYSEKHQGNWEKAALQMKVSRAVAKFGVWPKKELERLREAHRYYEEKRYQLILARMKENGGCKVWDWKPQHIEAMLVKLGVEEPAIDEKTGTRRRKNKTAARRRANSQNGHHHPSSVMNDWSGGLGLHPAFQGHHVTHHNAGARQSSFEMMNDEASSIAPTFSSEQENEYLDQIFNNNKIKAEGSLSPELMDLAYGEDDRQSSHPTPRDMGQHQSERVARQACEQMMQHQQQQQQ